MILQKGSNSYLATSMSTGSDSDLSAVDDEIEKYNLDLVGEISGYCTFFGD